MIAARLVRRARRGAGLSQRALAREAGLPQSTVARIESGILSPRTDTLERILRAAGRTLTIEPVLGTGEDLSLIHDRLRMTPAERARLAVREARMLARVDAAVGRAHPRESRGT
jgi:transcriptional regulator with XRE-family HTH domain